LSEAVREAPPTESTCLDAPAWFILAGGDAAALDARGKVMTTQIAVRLTKTDGKYFVDVVLDGETSRHGPYDDTNAAEAMATRLLRFGRALTNSRLSGA
jgi:hypothetical protein